VVQARAVKPTPAEATLATTAAVACHWHEHVTLFPALATMYTKKAETAAETATATVTAANRKPAVSRRLVDYRTTQLI